MHCILLYCINSRLTLSNAANAPLFLPPIPVKNKPKFAMGTDYMHRSCTEFFFNNKKRFYYPLRSCNENFKPFIVWCSPQSLFTNRNWNGFGSKTCKNSSIKATKNCSYSWGVCPLLTIAILKISESKAIRAGAHVKQGIHYLFFSFLPSNFSFGVWLCTFWNSSTACSTIWIAF